MGGILLPVLSAIFILNLVSGEFYDKYTGNEISPAKFAEFQRLGLIQYCAIEVKPCDPKEPRRLDYTCNNLYYPPYGTMMTKYRRMLPPEFGPGYSHRTSLSGKPLPNVRSVRVSIMSDGRVASKKYTQLMPYALVTLIGDTSSVHDVINYVIITPNCCATGESNPRCMPVYIPDDDIHLRYSNVRCMNLTKSVTYQDLNCVPRTEPPERVNLNTPLLDMSILYGNDEAGIQRSREHRGGRLKSEMLNGKDWPPSGGVFCVQNSGPQETRCHDLPVPIANSIIGNNLIVSWFFRMHNDVARKLEKMNPCWDDEKIYREAKEIIIAASNKIWYYELMTAILGYDFLIKNKAIFDTYGHVNDYDENLLPQMSIEYVSGVRWFHSMQEGRMKLYDNDGKLLDEIKTMELTLRTGALPNNRTLEKITQSMFRQPAAEADNLIDPEPGERILGNIQYASDIMSIDIFRNRDLGHPPYYKYRKICGLPVPKSFEDLLGWMNKDQVEALRMHYERVEDMDLMPGLISEKLMPGSTVGPTLACILVDQLQHWRRSDRFWFENNVHPGAFTEEQLFEIRKMTMARVMCDYADDVDSVQPNVFLLDGKGNEITDCKNIREGINLEAWRDESCNAATAKGKSSN